MPISDVKGKARALYEARRSRVAISPFTDEDPTLGMADGYAVQSELIKLILADGDRIIGYKAGLTSKPMQTMLGVDQPDYGPVLGSTVYRDGDEISVGRFIEPKVEAEIVLVLGRRTERPGRHARRRARAVSGAAAVDGDRRLPIRRLAHQAGRHRRRPRQQRRDGHVRDGGAARPTSIRGSSAWCSPVTVTLVDTGAGAAALGNPFAVVAWLANTLGADGIALQPGHVIMTGALHAAVPMQPGESYLAEFDRLGSVACASSTGGARQGLGTGNCARMARSHRRSGVIRRCAIASVADGVTR